MIGEYLRNESAGGALARFTRDLTADARAGRLEPVRCRDNEVSRVIDILLRHGKNNPTLVGPAGVGKTAIAEGLAQRIASGNVPLVLRSARLLSLDHMSLLAGTTYRGQYEERVRAIVAETTSAADAILFIDELHNLIGQGTAIGTAMDAANMLKPALVRGDFRVIGATTSGEYEKWVEGDPALERRFQKVVVRELGEIETMEILQARKERLERHHNVLISDEALRAAVKLTDRYVKDRMRPDKAIDAIDEACAHLQAVTEYSPHTEEMIRRRVELLKHLARDDREREKEDEERRRDTERRDRESGGDREPNAFERFGAELEALFVGAPAPVGGVNEGAQVETAARPVRTASLAPLESDLARQLMEEGIVIRGHDIARVVGLMAGVAVAWEDGDAA
ncbi:MAG TPA: AAA family ATPase [Gemmatimonadaceae bacterium]|jgi:ATP-dependent Clp protease ATP-binding subunit ClpA|nr:AAA family ATPase [Gemmatimonadaceae bacterium]